MNNIEKLFIKANIFESEFLNDIKNKYNISHVIIEEPLLKSNNVNTVDTLIKFNGIISNSIYKTLNIVPEYISSYEARKYAFPDLMSIRRYNKDGSKCDYKKIISNFKKNELVLFGEYTFDCDKKLILWNKINEIFPFIQWVYDKDGELKKENFDASDALVTCLAYANKEKYGELMYGRNFSIDNINISKNESELTYDILIFGKKYNKKITF